MCTERTIVCRLTGKTKTKMQTCRDKAYGACGGVRRPKPNSCEGCSCLSDTDYIVHPQSNSADSVFYKRCRDGKYVNRLGHALR